MPDIQTNSVPNFNHSYKLLIGQATDTSKKTNANGTFTSKIDLDTKLASTKKSSGTMKLLTEHQITFSIKKDNNKDPNKGSIVIYNLSDDTVNYINRLDGFSHSQTTQWVIPSLQTIGLLV